VLLLLLPFLLLQQGCLCLQLVCYPGSYRQQQHHAMLPLGQVPLPPAAAAALAQRLPGSSCHMWRACWLKTLLQCHVLLLLLLMASSGMPSTCNISSRSTSQAPAVQTCCAAMFSLIKGIRSTASKLLKHCLGHLQLLHTTAEQVRKQ
jgi:hypothetical protein